MKILPASLLLLAAVILAACANEPQHDSQGRELKLETIHRPLGPTTYQYRPVNQ